MATTLTLSPMVVSTVNILVLVGGGIRDGRTVVAALSLGADGVKIGARFIVSEKCNIHLASKRRIIESDASDIKLIMRGVFRRSI